MLVLHRNDENHSNIDHKNFIEPDTTRYTHTYKENHKFMVEYIGS